MSSGSSSDKEVPLPPLIPREAVTEQETKPGYEKESENYEKSPRNYNDKMEGIAGYVPTQRLEWKRYKQYTRNDIMAAIEEVKKGRSHLTGTGYVSRYLRETMYHFLPLTFYFSCPS